MPFFTTTEREVSVKDKNAYHFTAEGLPHVNREAFAKEKNTFVGELGVNSFCSMLKPANICADKDIYIITYIHSAPSNKEMCKFILKTDNDTSVNIFNLVNICVKQRVSPSQKWVECSMWTRSPILRNTRSKWFVSMKEFKGNSYPPYCAGYAFIMSTVSAPALWEASLQVPFFWVDDVYITGLVAAKAKLLHKGFNQAYGKFAGHGVIFSHLGQHSKTDSVQELWKKIAGTHARSVPSL